MNLMHVRKLRLDRSIPQKKLADRTGIKLSDLSKIERGLLRPDAHQTAKLAAALCIDPKKLIDGHDNFARNAEFGEGYTSTVIADVTVTNRVIDPPADRWKVLDLFCGCGGLSYGFEATDKFAVTAGIDLLQDRITTFRKNHQYATTLVGDIRKINSQVISDAALDPDVIVGGPPCQGFSSIRPFRTLTEGDARNSLVEEFVAIVGSLKPRWFLFENVVGLLNHGAGQPFKDLLKGFEDAGYTVDWRVINMALLGLPQTRERLVIVGSRDGTKFPWPRPTHASDYKGMAGRRARRLENDIFTQSALRPALTVMDAIMDLPPIPSGGEARHYLANQATEYTSMMRGDVGRLSLHEATTHNAKMLHIIRLAGANKAALPPGLVSSGFSSCYSRLDANKPSVTLTVNFVHPASNRCIHPVQDRALTPREGARIQGFPDKFEFAGSRAQIVKQIGNAVPPLLGEALANKIAECLSKR